MQAKFSLLSYFSSKLFSLRTKVTLWSIQFIVVLGLLIMTQFIGVNDTQSTTSHTASKPLQLNADLTSLFDSQVNQSIISGNVTSKAAQIQAQKNVADKLSQSASSQNIVLIGASELALAINQADAFAQKLAQLPLVSAVKINFSQMAQLSDISEFYLPFKQQLLSQKMSSLLAQGSNDDIFSYQFSLLTQVANQAVNLTVAQAPQLTLADFLTRPLFGSSALTLQNEHLVSRYENKYYVFVSFSTQGDGINIDTAQQFSTDFEQLIKQQASPLTLEKVATDVEYLYTGAIFYTSKASAIGQHEMMLYGGISLLATLLLIAFVYRSMTAMLATFTLIAISFVYGYLALSLFYTEISVIALVFSVTLIGIAADYSFHALTQLKFTRFNDTTHKQPLASIHASLLMSYLTTGAGYSLLLLAPFTLFNHIAVFTLFGLLGALITVLLLYPVFLPLLNNSYRTKSVQIAMPSFASGLNRLQQRFVLLIARYKWLVIGIFISTLALMPLLQFDNDIRRYYSADAELQANENKVKSVLQQKWDLQYFLVEASSEQGVLALEEQLTPKLTTLIESGRLAGFSAVSQWLPSVDKQQANKALLKEATEQEKFARLQGMISQGDWLITETFTPLLPKQWLQSDLGKMYTSQWLNYNNKFYSVIRLAGVQDVNQLSIITDQLALVSDATAQITLIDKAGSISTQLSQFSAHLIWVVLAAVVAALLVFVSRYGIQVALLAVATPVFSLMLALLCSFYLQEQLTIFNLVASILILALGLDYSVFYAEHGLQKKVTLTTVTSALSSVFVFAILVFSSMNAISNFGLTVFIGVLITFILAPIVTLASGQLKN